jgi:lipoprotein-anchoring transpeptidase ErfK/SrfK
MNFIPARFPFFLPARMSLLGLAGVTTFALLLATLGARGDDDDARPKVFSSKLPVVRQYTLDERIRYQLWDYVWKPDPTQPITRIEVRLGEQRVYVYQGDKIAGESPITTGKPGHDTPPGHYTIILKDIDHKSNLYGLLTDANGNVIDGNAEAGHPVPPGLIYDAADMPYYLRIRDDGVGLHAGYLPGYPASHGCIRQPNAFAELLYWNVSVGTPVDVVP